MHVLDVCYESVHQIHPSESLYFLLFVQFKATFSVWLRLNFHMVRGGIHTGQVANLLQVWHREPNKPFTPAANLESPVKVFWLLTRTGSQHIPNLTDMHGDNILTLHRIVPGNWWIWPSCSEATILTAVPEFHHIPRVNTIFLYYIKKKKNLTYKVIRVKKKNIEFVFHPSNDFTCCFREEQKCNF